jgi:hypothetical protein
MKANELRIGNLVIANNLLYRKEGENKIACVVGIDSEKEYNDLISSITIYHIDDEFKDTYGQWIKHLEPIPLTEEWLIKLGFSRIDKYTFVKSGIFIHMRKRGFVFSKKLIVENVNQLQNLYFALTKKELTMK